MLPISYAEVIARLNRAGAERTPCFFVLNYEQSEGYYIERPLAEGAELGGLAFSVGDYHSPAPPQINLQPEILAVEAESYERYAQRFAVIYEGIQHGDSFLCNLTVRTPISLSCISLEQIYPLVRARYKVLLPKTCLCYSPEIFVRIKQSEISTYPMKGTIDAQLPDAEAKLLSDYKEHCEHCTIVDLMRNDLSRVAEEVRVRRFKYIEELRTSRGPILQMSSEVVGQLDEGWHARMGTILDALLPAGSISGAPKERTCQLIREAEGQPRAYYTGICGYYDGNSLDTGVMIRFIEQEGERFYYRSGGGITINSRPEEEYAECLQKVYLPR